MNNDVENVNNVGEFNLLSNLNGDMVKRQIMLVKSSEKHQRNQVNSRGIGGIVNYSRPRTNSPFPHMREKNGNKSINRLASNPNDDESSPLDYNNSFNAGKLAMHNNNYTRLQLIPITDEKNFNNNVENFQYNISSNAIVD